jgi:hypothetical protein
MRIDMVIINSTRMGHIPHPPSWNPSANILRTVIRLLLEIPFEIERVAARCSKPPRPEKRGQR